MIGIDKSKNSKDKDDKMAPLADRLRPENLADFVGQADIVGEGKLLRKLIEQDETPSLIFWGPPGSGKTTLAKIIARMSGAGFVAFSAVTSGVAELRAVIKEAAARLKEGKRTILFIDEIHRWSKSQQDALLPHVEDGTVTLIGATTENPSFEVNSALLSRCRVFVLKQLDEEAIKLILQRALTDKKKGLGALTVKISDEALDFLATVANGDARNALNALELAAKTGAKNKKGEIVIEKDLIKESLQKSYLMYDKGGEEHYNIISALHKSMRGSDADAALYWLGRMLEGGEDPLYVARRLIRFASEDVGLANSLALVQAVAGYQACHYIGMPECEVVLAQVVVYLAKCKKSNELYEAYNQIKRDVRETINEPVPLHIRNAPTKLMKDLGYSKGYKYSPDFDYQEEQEYLPERLKGKKYLRGEAEKDANKNSKK
ncbi:MAG TPA: replication-associated recombination protein A [Candidatus Paceibacterota bacterium]|jgi:putative ATPase|nr:replication-associated recombination protein A [Candidatus Paceibacterota bacterium]HOH11585.1 replication-associated recombination protein A [Candidatus Paceibacterota bacterium]HOY11460.1 replication-associated recombination protein A [Candidatus Paceibacterota bacterium]HPI24796.1 replication-associated recombination protein A [Candidatus Paceibacterota bacterium]HPN89577.1 replication-associated recombination protein A [Candidatus Paceibacterota bacterium]